MSLKQVHPEYSNALQSWVEMRDFYKGQAAVKAKGITYLPPTSGMKLDGMGAGEDGLANYTNYLARAVFPDYVKEGVEALIGLLHQHDAKIELPPRMEYLRKKASINGESLAMLMRKINEEQLVTGRIGVLVDLPADPDPTNPEPFMSLYAAESITNWDNGDTDVGVNNLRMVVLNESKYMKEGDFQWVWRDRFRVLKLDGDKYVQKLFDGDNYVAEELAAPMLRGTTLQEIPFVFINSKDLLALPDIPPLEGLGQNCLTIYRGEADYRQNLHMQGQDTLVTVGGIRNANALPGEPDAVRVGAGSRLDVELGGDAKFIGVSSMGLSEQRNCIENDRKRAEFKAGQLIGNESNKNESGNAMLARLAAQTANLTQIATTCGEGIERSLKQIAVWMGEDPSKVKVTPNTEFTNAASNAQELVYLMTARGLGAPLSMQSIHTNLKEKGYTSLDYEDEKKLVEEEGPNGEEANVGAEKATANAPVDDKSSKTKTVEESKSK